MRLKFVRSLNLSSDGSVVARLDVGQGMDSDELARWMVALGLAVEDAGFPASAAASRGPVPDPAPARPESSGGRRAAR